MILLLAAARAAELPDPAVSAYYARRLRHNAELVEDDWTVLEGGLALASRDFAVKVGDADGLRRLNRTRRAWLAVGGATAAVGVAWTALLTAPALLGPPDETGAGPVFVFVTGPALVALPLVAIHLGSRPSRAPVSAFYDRPSAETWIAGYNQALAAELALDPAALP